MFRHSVSDFTIKLTRMAALILHIYYRKMAVALTSNDRTSDVCDLENRIAALATAYPALQAESGIFFVNLIVVLKGFDFVWLALALHSVLE